MKWNIWEEIKYRMVMFGYGLVIAGIGLFIGMIIFSIIMVVVISMVLLWKFLMFLI